MCKARQGYRPTDQTPLSEVQFQGRCAVRRQTITCAPIRCFLVDGVLAQQPNSTFSTDATNVGPGVRLVRMSPAFIARTPRGHRQCGNHLGRFAVGQACARRVSTVGLSGALCHGVLPYSCDMCDSYYSQKINNLKSTHSPQSYFPIEETTNSLRNKYDTSIQTLCSWNPVGEFT